MTSIQRECDKLFQQVIVRRDPFCKRCGGKTLAGHHIFGRSNLSTRYVLENGIGLCLFCHKWVHEHPTEFEYIMIAKMMDKYFSLQRLSREIVKNFDFKECRKYLRGLLK